jgi:uncharacterized protein
MTRKNSQHSTDQAPHGIQIRVRNLPDGEHPIEIQRFASVLDFPAFQDGLSLKGTLTKEGERIHILAKAVADGHFECTRCSDPFDRTIEALLKVEFVPPRLESDPEDENIHVYDPLAGPAIDITDDVRDALALAIPMKHLCKENCKGLCPTCGKNRNHEDCDCEMPQELNENWSALKDLQSRLRAEEIKAGGPGK